MSYNIDTIEALRFENVRISKKKLKQLLKKHESELPEDLPEINWLAEHENVDADEHGDVRLKHIWWSGERSGGTHEVLLKTLEHVMGHAELVLTWEGGDSLSGIAIDDGKVESCGVEQKLVREEKAPKTSSPRRRRGIVGL